MPSKRSLPPSPASRASRVLSRISTRPIRRFWVATVSSSSSSGWTAVALRAIRRSCGCEPRSPQRHDAVSSGVSGRRRDAHGRGRAQPRSAPRERARRRGGRATRVAAHARAALRSRSARSRPRRSRSASADSPSDSRSGAAALVARVWPLSIALQNVVSMLGLGLGVDYTLLLVTRFREARAAGRDPEAAAIEAATPRRPQRARLRGHRRGGIRCVARRAARRSALDRRGGLHRRDDLRAPRDDAGARRPRLRSARVSSSGACSRSGARSVRRPGAAGRRSSRAGRCERCSSR